MLCVFLASESYVFQTTVIIRAGISEVMYFARNPTLSKSAQYIWQLQSSFFRILEEKAKD
jgi:hypothetical protein